MNAEPVLSPLPSKPAFDVRPPAPHVNLLPLSRQWKMLKGSRPFRWHELPSSSLRPSSRVHLQATRRFSRYRIVADAIGLMVDLGEFSKMRREMSTRKAYLTHGFAPVRHHTS